MHILIGLVLACGLLYFWLAGNWFARVLTFLPLAVLFAVLCGAGGKAAFHPTFTPAQIAQFRYEFTTSVRLSDEEVSERAFNHSGPGIGYLTGAMGIVAAWYVSGIPIWYWRRRMRIIASAERRLPHLAG